MTQEKAALRIAVAGPMSGPFAQMGEQMRRGVLLAVEDINARGGIDGRSVELDVADDRGDGETAQAVARNLAKSGVQFVIGHFNSGASIAASEVYAKMGVFMISPASTNPFFTERSGKAKKLWNTHRTSGRDDVQGTVLGRYIAEKFPGRNVAVLDDDTPYGQGLSSKALAALKSAGQPATLSASIEQGQKDFSALVARMKNKQISVVFFGGLDKDMGRLVQQSDKAGLKLQFVAGDGVYTFDFPKIAGTAAEGTLMAFSKEDRSGPDAKAIVERFRGKGFEPEAYTLKAYAAVQVIAKGAEIAGNSDPKAIAKAIRSGASIPTVLGPLTFDSNGDRREPDVAIYAWRKDGSGNLVPAQID
ncbi:branched-chain amino acid ABC transporter substrate-binding protein [Aminobacter sp. BE322]|uniref:branched-chain amino acid ABC transporter substrate-binding protein n=1 Tax=unclassified Aminobacter TaxID=2644704 RepID=UPI003D21820D